MVKDNEAVVDGQIAPLIQRMTSICDEHGIPFVVQIQYSPKGVVRSMGIPDHAVRSMLEVRGLINLQLDREQVISMGFPDEQGGEHGE